MAKYKGRHAYLIRHGQSEANAGHATTKAAEVRLTKLGRLQAAVAALALRELGIEPEMFVLSPYKRAIETAAYSRQVFSEVREVRRWPIQEFTYLPGGKSSTVESRGPEREKYWNENDPYRIVDLSRKRHCESYSSFARRVGCTAIALGALQQTAAVFGHEQFFTQLLFQQTPEGRVDIDSYLYGPDAAHMRKYREFIGKNRIPNGGIVRFDTIRRTSELIFAPPEDESRLREVVERDKGTFFDDEILHELGILSAAA